MVVPADSGRLLSAKFLSTPNDEKLLAKSGSPGPLTSTQPFEVVAESWDAVQDFSLRSNPSGAWTYGVELSLGRASSPFTLGEHNCAKGIDCWQNTLPFPNSAEVAKNNTPYTSKQLRHCAVSKAR